MLNSKIRLFGIAVVALPAALASADVTYTDLYTLGAPANASYASAFGGSSYHNAAGGQSSGSFRLADQSSVHALLWTPANPSGIDLNPVNASSSQLYGTNGDQQVGYLSIGSEHAGLWSGTAASAVDLNPKTMTVSDAYAVNGNQQVGDGVPLNSSTYFPHALLWTGTAASAIDLHPNGYYTSSAFGTDGTQQVGVGSLPISGDSHALLWTGSAASAVDLNPTGFETSQANGVSGGEQVGMGEFAEGTDIYHALLWKGSADSAVDLNPAGFVISLASATDGDHEVGFAAHTPAGIGTITTAMFWNGSADNYIDLGALLPTSYTSSTAISISGNLIYGFAMDAAGHDHAIVWTVPEPTSIGLIAMTGWGLLRRTSRRR